jgi:hypothetical protein
MMTTTNVLVAGFSGVRISTALLCPTCSQAFRPHSFRVVDGLISLICTGCHVTAAEIEIDSIPDWDDRDEI